jgi:L-ascorbate metabolism protein UlaG (beta-lactamase superfamily)
MKITKFGHCCLLIEEKGLRILTDPGNYTTQQNEVTDIDIILITHEHGDHLHIESVKKIVTNNPGVLIITNKSVAPLLDEAEIPYTLINDKDIMEIKSVLFEAYEEPHAIIHSSLPRVQNSGFFIAKKLFYPGDALIDPQKEIDILALPVAGPWIKISEAIDYALKLKPKKCFPVHDAGLKSPGIAHRIPRQVLAPHNIEFVVIENDSSMEF